METDQWMMMVVLSLIKPSQTSKEFFSKQNKVSTELIPIETNSIPGQWNGAKNGIERKIGKEQMKIFNFFIYK